jgi:regulation of enolase protein 1 (concanavalin A-like superfamily)
MQWLNPPASLTVDGGELLIETGAETDFWQTTYYGFRHDDGHFLHRPAHGEFTAETRFTGAYEELYDQAGLMIRHDADHWMKCGVEFTDGVCHFSTVVTTRGRSDWSAFALPADTQTISARVSRLDDALFVQYRMDNDPLWRMARLAYFPPELAALSVGIAACSPKRSGFRARFHGFSLTAPVSRDIH